MAKFDQLIGTELARGTWAWSSDDASLYAVGVGAGLEDPFAELEFTTENTANLPQQVIPSFLTLASTGKQLWMRPLGFKEREWGGMSWGWPEGMVHGEEGVTLARPLPPEGTATVSLVLTGVYDKGSAALVIVDKKTALADSGDLLGVARSSFFIRGQGGFGGPRGPADERAWVKPDHDPDVTVVLATLPGQSLIYRLSGDHNPHCTDPARARADGFERPIFQGMGTYGFGCRALLKGLCGGDVQRFGGMYARLSQPVFPGEKLETRIWRSEGGAQFQTFASGGRVVLDRGFFTFAA
jgi:acyl dehydratase